MGKHHKSKRKLHVPPRELAAATAMPRDCRAGTRIPNHPLPHKGKRTPLERILDYAGAQRGIGRG